MRRVAFVCFTLAAAACAPSSPVPDAATPDAADDGSTTCVAGGDLPVCPPDPPHYQGNLRDVIAAHCVSCHYPGTTIARGDFSTYANVFADHGSIENQIYSCFMPPVGSLPLTATERAALMTWLVCGAPNN